jgi:nitrate reductase NapE component
MGTIPIGLSNARTAEILKVKKQMGIFLFYSLTNLWTSFFVLALFWFPALAEGPEFWDNFNKGMVKILSFQDMGSFWTWCAMIAQLPSNAATAALSKKESATYSTIILALAPALAGAFMGIKTFMGRYYEPVNWTTWVSMVVVIGAVVLYKIGSYLGKKDSKGYEKINQSRE